MSKDTPIPTEFQEIAAICAATDVVIGGQVALGIADARKLHEGLRADTAFKDWMRRRIKALGLVEGTDFEEVSLKNEQNLSGGRPTKDYRLTLDAAKHIAMVEKNEVGRLVRSYFIWVENNARALVSGSHLSAREVGGISKGVVNKALAPLQAQIATLMEEVRSLVLAHPTGVAVCSGMTAKEWLIEYKCEQKGRNPIVRKVSADLRDLALRHGIVVDKCARTGTWVFPSSLARPYMDGPGRALVRRHNDTVRTGQGALRLKPPKRRK